MKEVLICPKCGSKAKAIFVASSADFYCNKCNWVSYENTVDISFKNKQNSPLSNLFPHKFEIDGIKCNSIESFIQSLRAKDPVLQEKICSEYSGAMAYRLRLLIGDWRKTGTVYWKGKEIVRDSDEYISLISRAYDCLFEQNVVFRHVLLNNYQGMYFIHSTGCDDKKETLLTEAEYRAQLNRLRNFKQY